MKLVIAIAIVTTLGVVLYNNANAQTKIAKEAQVELGSVNWGRDLEVAKKQSAETGKPIFVLFQEVPG